MSPPTSLWEGEGQVRLRSLISVFTGGFWLGPHPSKERRGSFPRGWKREAEGGGGGGGGMRDDAPTSTASWLMSNFKLRFYNQRLCLI